MTVPATTGQFFPAPDTFFFHHAGFMPDQNLDPENRLPRLSPDFHMLPADANFAIKVVIDWESRKIHLINLGQTDISIHNRFGDIVIKAGGNFDIAPVITQIKWYFQPDDYPQGLLLQLHLHPDMDTRNTFYYIDLAPGCGLPPMDPSVPC